MRLTCPSCGAQYEVPDDVIPEEGRDVQCSNCGKTWFQPRNTAESPEALAAEAAAPKDAVWHPEVESAPKSQPAPGKRPAASAPDKPPVPKRRELDPAVADILREEAELEARAREAQGLALDEQPDLGLQEPEDEAAKRARQAQERMRRLRGENPEAAAAVAAAAAVTDRPQSRGEMLPDIEEINQTLRASSERREIQSVQADLEDEDDQKGGFGRGFIFMILLFTIATALYVFAPQLGETVPQLKAPMDSYVVLVDKLRAWLDTQVGALVLKVNELMSGGPAPDGS